MANAIITLKQSGVNSGDAMTIICQGVTVSGKKTNQVNPNANFDGDIVKIHNVSIDNPVYTINNVRFTGASGVLTYANLLALFRSKFTGSDPVYLKVVYGKTGSTSQLVDSQGATESDGIATVVKGFSFSINVVDSQDGYLPVATITLIETKTS